MRGDTNEPGTAEGSLGIGHAGGTTIMHALLQIDKHVDLGRCAQSP